MGIRLAKAMGNEVTAISTSPNKAAVAKSIGASHFVVSTDPESMKAATKSLDLILNTVSANHQCEVYLPLLRRKGVIVMLGVVTVKQQISQLALIVGKNAVTGSAIGGVPETQACIDFCHKHKIVPETKLITYDKLSDVYATLEGKNDSITRYVLDLDKSVAMSNL